MDKIEKARKGLQRHSGNYPAIAKATGLGLEWLRKFAQGVIDEPRVRKLEKLQKWLDAQA